MARDEDTSKEGVDFKWVPMKDSKGNIVKDGKGGAVKTRHFFTKKEKEEMKKPATKAEKKAAPAKRKEEPTATSVKTPKVTTTRLSDVKGGRGDGLTEMVRRAIDRADKEKKMEEDTIPTRGPAKAKAKTRTQMEARGKPHNPNYKPSTSKSGFQGRYSTAVVPGGINPLNTSKKLANLRTRGGGSITKNKLLDLE